VQLAVADSRSVMQATTEEMTQVRTRVQAISAGILALADRMQAIEEVLRFMAEIASETHLLALNATIEAAGAGPYGTRFSIIAGQVQELATQANAASEQITTLVEDIRGAMQQTVSIGQAGVAEVDQGVEMVQDLERVHTRIEGLVSQTRDLAFAISVATQQQRDGSKQIAQTVSTLAETAHTSEAESRQALATATNLNTVAQYLREAAAQFHLEGRP
jgi:methyl-accepting chemotaxis protein